MKSQTSKGQQPRASVQPADAKSTGKKMVTHKGNFFINFSHYFFFMTPEGTYLPWIPTLKYGELPNSQEWHRMRTAYKMPVLELTTKELLAAKTIWEALKADRYYGLTSLQKALATVHRSLHLRQKVNEAAMATSKPAPAKRFVPVKASQPKQVPVHPVKKYSREKNRTRVIDITSFNRELGVDTSIPVEIRRAGENLVVRGNFSNTNKLNKAPGFNALYKLQFAEN